MGFDWGNGMQFGFIKGFSECLGFWKGRRREAALHCEVLGGCPSGRSQWLRWTRWL